MKQVGQGNGPPTFDKGKKEGNPNCLPPAVNIYDVYALEGAMDCKQRNGNTEVIALTFGPEGFDELLRYSLARGVDHAVRIWQEGIALDDPFTIGKILAQFARWSDGSLVFCGMMSEDSCSAMMPAIIAKELSWPWVNRVIRVEHMDKDLKIRVVQKAEKGGRLETSLGIPAVVAFCPNLDGFRYVSLHRRLHKQHNALQLYRPDDLGIVCHDANRSDPPIKIKKIREPKPRTKRTAIASQAISGEDLMWAMISGTKKKQDDNLIRAAPSELAESILNFLMEKGMLDPSRVV
jgi:electron transfer flavoprotein alpha/beta subunit